MNRLYLNNNNYFNDAIKSAMIGGWSVWRPELATGIILDAHMSQKLTPATDITKKLGGSTKPQETANK
ncbi:MAG: hypothetical protein NTY75_00250 [Candidatus Shapirobacteria bacterium]|nr:hypothetical protein [Candidatus Shapirobacteria bacterium]